jgi:hypothetical protein
MLLRSRRPAGVVSGSRMRMVSGSPMRERGGKCRGRSFALVATFLLGAAVAAPGPAVAGTPAQDQYTANIPTSHGGKANGGQKPVAHPGDLSPQAQAATSGPDQKLLTQIATASQLGAPATASKHHGSDGALVGPGGGSSGGGSGGAGSGGTGVDLSGTGHSLPAAVVGTANSGPGLWLLIVLGTIAAAGAFTLFRRRRARSGPTQR